MSAGPMRQRHENRGHGLLDANLVELADGGVSGDDDGTSVTASTSRVDRHPNLKLYRPLSTPATELGGSALAHGGARPCFGLTGPAWMVTSSPEHQCVMEKARWELGKEERSGAVLATESATPARSGRRRESKCGHYLGSPAQWRDGRARGGYGGAVG